MTARKPKPTPTTPEELVRQYSEQARLHTDAARTSLAARDAAIVAMRAAGFSHRAIGEAAGLTHTAIQLILKRDQIEA